MRERLRDALKGAGADYAEIRYEINETTHIACRGKDMDDVSVGAMQRGIVRACTRGGWGEAVFDSDAELAERVRDACESAALVGKERTELAPVPVAADGVRAAAMARDFRGVQIADKQRLIRSYNDILLRHDAKIETTHVQYEDRFRTVHFASSRGACFTEERPYMSLLLVAVARDGNLVQQAHESVASSVSFDAVVGLDEQAERVASGAVDLLAAPRCEGGACTVLVDPKLGGVFAHEAFGHLSEGDFLYENPKMRALMQCGKRFGGPHLTIIDDGTISGMTGTHAWDDEGTPVRKTHLIENGVLTGHLHSLETAAKMGEEPTGNARAVRGGMPPIVRMRNTYIDAGTESYEDLMGGIDKGLYVCDALGGQTMMEMFTFSAAHAYRIENGEKGELVRDVVLTGNVFETLHRIDGFGNDLRIFQSGGGCGKGGQSPLPVTFGAPHLRIRDVVVGGTA